jgi:hypothetical protein
MPRNMTKSRVALTLLFLSNFFSCSAKLLFTDLTVEILWSGVSLDEFTKNCGNARDLLARRTKNNGEKDYLFTKTVSCTAKRKYFLSRLRKS